MNENNMNIPDFSVSEAVSVLETIYTGALENNTQLSELPTPFFWGPAGVGKSQGVYQLAKKLEKNTGKKVIVTDIRLLLFSPVDLRGVPVADENRRFSNWLRPGIFNMDENENVLNLIFLDELSAAPQSVQAAAYQICLDRKVGEHKLPQNSIVIAAGNRTTDGSVSYRMPLALCNRLMHFNIIADFNSWRKWAIENNIDPRVTGYLAFDNSALETEAASGAFAYPTPRSWSFVSSILKNTGLEPSACLPMISSCIGTDAALAFVNWCALYDDLPKTSDILGGKCSVYPKKHDSLYAVMSSITYAILSKKDKLNALELENACAYMKRFPADFAMTFFTDLSSVEEVKFMLMRCKNFTEWLSKNKNML